MEADIDIEIDPDVFLPAYRHLLPKYLADDQGGMAPQFREAAINLLWGGRDSGKSYFIAERLIIDCLFAPANSWRCLLIKKTGNSIKESQWQTIKDVTASWGIEHLFDFKLSPLAIECVNGNKFLARGCDDPGKIKSIAGYGCAWIEEGNQLEEADYITIMTSLRSNTQETTVWISFNPETADVDYEEHWLYKYFFKNQKGDIYGQPFYDTITIKKPDGEEVEFVYTSTHTTYHDNLEHVTPLRQALHEDLANRNPHYYEVFTRGRWATMKPGQLWAFAYDKEKHSKLPELDRMHEVYLSFDFNRNPICCSVIQHYDQKIKVLETVKIPNSNIYQLCDYIDIHYPKCLFIVTGDATGRASNALVQDDLNYYIYIKNRFNLSDAQIDVPTVNPDLKENSMLTNMVLSEYTVEIHTVKAKALHYDLGHVRALPNGKIDKGNRDDPTKQADALDTFRYWCNVFMQWLLPR